MPRKQMEIEELQEKLKKEKASNLEMKCVHNTAPVTVTVTVTVLGL